MPTYGPVYALRVCLSLLNISSARPSSASPPFRRDEVLRRSTRLPVHIWPTLPYELPRVFSPKRRLSSRSRHRRKLRSSFLSPMRRTVLAGERRLPDMHETGLESRFEGESRLRQHARLPSPTARRNGSTPPNENATKSNPKSRKRKNRKSSSKSRTYPTNRSR